MKKEPLFIGCNRDAQMLKRYRPIDAPPYQRDRPSMSLHQEELLKLKGASFYEERLLYLLMLLRRPRTATGIYYFTNDSSTVVDYYCICSRVYQRVMRGKD